MTTVASETLRKRIDERALEKEEEDYFNEQRFLVSIMPIGCFFFFLDEREGSTPPGAPNLLVVYPSYLVTY